MEYQKTINLLDNTPNQPTDFRSKKWVQINEGSHGAYNTNIQIKFNTSMLRSNLCDYSDAYLLLSGTGDGDDAAAKWADERNKRVISKNCVPFTDCTSEINNTPMDNAKQMLWCQCMI